MRIRNIGRDIGRNLLRGSYDHQFSASKKIFTLPNAITLVGIAAILSYAAQFMSGKYTIFLLPMLVLIGLSDLFDGYVARTAKQCTTIGKRLDALRDQLFVAVAVAHVFFLGGWESVESVFGIILLSSVMLDFLIVYCYMPFQSIQKRNAMESGSVRLLGKLKAIVYGLCLIIVIVQWYYVHAIFMPHSCILFTMMVVSACPVVVLIKKALMI